MFITTDPSEAAFMIAAEEAKTDIDLYLYGSSLLKCKKKKSPRDNAYNRIANSRFTGGPVQRWRKED